MPCVMTTVLPVRRQIAALVLALLASSPVVAAAQRAGAGGASGAGAAARPDTGLRMGSFVSSRIDGKKLPVKDLVTDDQGTQYLIEFAELVLTLQANGEFRAVLRYRQTLAPKGVPTSQEPVQRMTVYGTWARGGGAIRFVPDPKRGGDGLRILNGTFTSKTVTVPFDYQNGRVTRRARVLLVFDPSII
jgi:hypothetical protein